MPRLRVEVLDDDLGTDDFVGRAEIDLRGVVLQPGHVTKAWFPVLTAGEVKTGSTLTGELCCRVIATPLPRHSTADEVASGSSLTATAVKAAEERRAATSLTRHCHVTPQSRCSRRRGCAPRIRWVFWAAARRPAATLTCLSR